MDNPNSDAAADWLRRWLSLSRRLRRRLSDRYAREGLSESRAVVLEALSSSTSSYTQANLANDLNLSESNLCALLDRMQEEGLLRRERSAMDRRKTLLSITPEGHLRCQRMQAALELVEADLETRLDPTLRPQIWRLLENLSQALQDKPAGIRRRRAS